MQPRPSDRNISVRPRENKISVRQSVENFPSVRPSVCRSVRPSVCLYVRLSVRLYLESICLEKYSGRPVLIRMLDFVSPAGNAIGQVMSVTEELMRSL